MFKPTLTKSVDEYLMAISEPRKTDIMVLHKFIQSTLPTFSPYFAYNMIGYGRFKYKNYKKEIIDWPVIALASQKNYISVYVCAVLEGRYVAEIYKDQLGKVSVGKSCIRFKTVNDINMDVLKTVLKKASENPGLVGSGDHAG